MPRPIKKRRVCAMPPAMGLEPVGGAADLPPIELSHDEYEVIRLMDLEGFTQVQCAEAMDVARTTVTAIYDAARAKLAEALIHRRSLIVSGGPVRLCEGRRRDCPLRRCERAVSDRKKEKEQMKMRIAVTYDNGQVFQHFGHTETFKFYHVEDGKVVDSMVLSTQGSGHSALAGFLTRFQVDALICGGIGGGARNALSAAGIEVYGGVTGSADMAVAALITGKLAFSADATCDHHHDHEHGHDCGEHTCGHDCH